MFQRLLVAIDESPAGEVTLDFASALARTSGALVHVFHVNQLLVNGRGYTELTETDAARLVEGAVRGLRAQGIGASGSMVRTKTFELPQAIADAATGHQCELIVMGSRRRRGRRFGHAVRERVAAISPLPILVAPAPLQIPRRRRGLDRLGTPSTNRPSPRPIRSPR